MARAWVMVAAIAVGGASALSADVEIFWDGFDQGDLCAWSNPPLVTYTEQEAFDEGGANDFQPDAELVPRRCGVIEGTIGEWYDSDPGPGEFPFDDWDTFEIGVAGPVMLRLTLERIGIDSEYQPLLEVNNSSEFFTFGLTSPGDPDVEPTTTSRQIYLPENGFDYPNDPGDNSKNIPGNNKWFVTVMDWRNQTEFPDFPYGGLGTTYRLTVTLEPIAGPTAIPLSQETVELGAGGANLVYRIDGAQVSTLNQIETFAERNAEPLDTKLYVVRKSGPNLTTLAGNDDFDPDDHLDSRLANVALDANPHFVIVDFYEKSVNDAVQFPLTIQFLQPVPSP